MRRAYWSLVLLLTLAVSGTVLSPTGWAADPPQGRGAMPSIGRAMPMLPQVGRPSPGAQKPDANGVGQFAEAPCVFVGRLLSAQAGPVARSMPPIYTYKLTFEISDVLRGDLKPDTTQTFSYSARQLAPPTFPVDESCIVAATFTRGNWSMLHLAKADKQSLRDVRIACSLPLGWTEKDGKIVSPWSELGEEAWSKNDELTAKAKAGGVLIGSKTGRPAWLVGSEATMSVEQVEPVERIKWTNPDGDGLYKITITNPADHKIVVPALLTTKDRILWDECLVIRCQGKTYQSPGCRGIDYPVEPLTLKPGQSVSTQVNAFLLQGPQWPKGGYRIAFTFCLGEKSSEQSFYYMTRHHEKIRLDAMKNLDAN